MSAPDHCPGCRTAGLWLRSKHGTWRFFLVTLNSLAGIDCEGKPLQPGLGQTLA